jgi:capsule polysaccharide export protein KpsE/RkpR
VRRLLIILSCRKYVEEYNKTFSTVFQDIDGRINDTLKLIDYVIDVSKLNDVNTQIQRAMSELETFRDSLDIQAFNHDTTVLSEKQSNLQDYKEKINATISKLQSMSQNHIPAIKTSISSIDALLKDFSQVLSSVVRVTFHILLVFIVSLL